MLFAQLFIKSIVGQTQALIQHYRQMWYHWPVPTLPDLVAFDNTSPSDSIICLCSFNTHIYKTHFGKTMVFTEKLGVLTSLNQCPHFRARKMAHRLRVLPVLLEDPHLNYITNSGCLKISFNSSLGKHDILFWPLQVLTHMGHTLTQTPTQTHE